MTIDSERRKAIMRTEKFLESLLDPKATPRVPSAIRAAARGLLRHYPWPSWVERNLPDTDDQTSAGGTRNNPADQKRETCDDTDGMTLYRVCGKDAFADEPHVLRYFDNEPDAQAYCRFLEHRRKIGNIGISQCKLPPVYVWKMCG